MTSLYEHAGEEALHRLEEVFYTKALDDPVLRHFICQREPHHVEHLTCVHCGIVRRTRPLHARIGL